MVARTISGMKYIDAHCHILSDADINAAYRAGAVGAIINATNVADWASVMDIAHRYDGFRGAIGIHPWHVADTSPDWASKMRVMLRSDSSLMIGETGLDTLRGDISSQIEFFRTHLEIAAEFNRVVHVHCVRAWGAMMDILRSSPRMRGIVFHAYSGPVELMPELARHNGYFSFGGAILNPRNVRAARAVSMAPRNRILVESDAPDSIIASADIPRVLAAVCEKSGIDTDTIYENTMGVIL